MFYAVCSLFFLPSQVNILKVKLDSFSYLGRHWHQAKEVTSLNNSSRKGVVSCLVNQLTSSLNSHW